MSQTYWHASGILQTNYHSWKTCLVSLAYIMKSTYLQNISLPSVSIWKTKELSTQNRQTDGWGHTNQVKTEENVLHPRQLEFCEDPWRRCLSTQRGEWWKKEREAQQPGLELHSLADSCGCRVSKSTVKTFTFITTTCLETLQIKVFLRESYTQTELQTASRLWVTHTTGTFSVQEKAPENRSNIQRRCLVAQGLLWGLIINLPSTRILQSLGASARRLSHM